MGTKVTRKSRDKVQKEVDLLKPIPVSIYDLGGEKDPCFGKHNDPSASECRRCGDCEVCSIVQAQKLHTVRGKAEQEMNFKDLEEEKLEALTPRQKFFRLVKAAIKEKNPYELKLLRRRAKVGLHLSDAKFDVYLEKFIEKYPDHILGKDTLTLKKKKK